MKLILDMLKNFKKRKSKSLSTESVPERIVNNFTNFHNLLSVLYSNPENYLKIKIKFIDFYDCETLYTIETFHLYMVYNEPISFKYIKLPDFKTCKMAVSSYGRNIYYIMNNPQLLLDFTKIQIYELQLEAVKNDGFAIEYIKSPSMEICLEAVSQNGRVLPLIDNLKKEIVLEAIKSDCFALCYLPSYLQGLILGAYPHLLNINEFEINREIYLPHHDEVGIKQIINEIIQEEKVNYGNK